MKPSRHSRFAPHAPHHRGAESFTLVEMLAVMALIALLTGLAAAAFNSVASANNVASGIYNISAFAELARNEAVARQSYVWLGCSNVSTGPSAPEVVLGAVASIDGSTNSLSTNLVPITQVLQVRGISLATWSSLRTATQNVFTSGQTESLITNSAGISFTVGNAQFSGSTITFTPRGEALLKGAPTPTDGYTENIDISLLQAHGTVVTNANDAAVVINGATGSPFVVRLQ